MNEIELVGTEAALNSPGEREAGPDRPWLYALLIAPSAVAMNGVIQGGTLAYLLSQQGVGSLRQSHVIALLSLPTSIYFLWSPITDFFVRRRTWLLIGGPTAAVLMAAAFHQKNLSSTAAMALMLVSACCGQLIVSSCGGMMGAIFTTGVRRRAGSFYQAGSLGFGALSAWGLVWLSSRIGQDALGIAAAAMIGLPSLLAIAAPKQQSVAATTFGETVREVGREFKATFLRREALPYIASMTFPMASGAAIGLLAGVAGQYSVSGDGVAWLNGLLGGLLMAAGSAAMSWLPERSRAPVAYMTVGLINAATLCIFLFGPLRPSTYYIGVPIYLLSMGTCNAMFTAVVLEFMGSSGKSGSGRYSIINGMGNLPVLYMLALDGWGGDRWGARGLAGVDAVVSGIGASVLLAYFLMRSKRVAKPS